MQLTHDLKCYISETTSADVSVENEFLRVLSGGFLYLYETGDMLADEKRLRNELNQAFNLPEKMLSRWVIADTFPPVALRRLVADWLVMQAKVQLYVRENA